jgi:hypothetical protein
MKSILALLIAVAATTVPAFAGEPCCAVTSVNASTGMVTAVETATGRSFQFGVTNAALLKTLHAGSPIYANFTSKQVSVDGATPCCGIVSLSAAGKAAATPAAPASSPASVANAGGTPASSARVKGRQNSASAAGAKTASDKPAATPAALTAPTVTAASLPGVALTGSAGTPSKPTSGIGIIKTKATTFSTYVYAGVHSCPVSGQQGDDGVTVPSNCTYTGQVSNGTKITCSYECK